MFKLVLGIIAVAVGFLGYGLYIRDIFSGKSKPHVFTWFIWGFMIGTAFVIQLLEGAGSGSWVTGAAAFMCLAIAVLAWEKGARHVETADWVCLVSAFVGLVLWKVTSNPLTAIIVIIVADFMAFLPTYRKAYGQPWTETYGVYWATALKYVIAMFALDSYDLAVWLYPAYIITSNSVFMMLVFLRRRVLAARA